jgi:putative tryptophan/tyrosine transport system substrate-binding protein
VIERLASVRCLILSLALAVFAALAVAEAQQPATKIWRIGFLGPGSAETSEKSLAALTRSLRELGYVEGDNTVIERRYADGNLGRVRSLAAELVRLKVDVLVAHGASASDAKGATTTIPIVFIANPDPVGVGLVVSLARPGGNLTGLSDLHSALVAKRLELLKELVPSASRVAVLSDSSPELALQLKDVQRAAPALGLTIVPVVVGAPGDIDRALDIIRKERADALSVLGTSLFAVHRRRIADFAIKSRIPTISTVRRFPDAGFLLSYGADFPDLYRRAALYVDKVLKGIRPADIPVEQPIKFELVVNLKTAKALGLTVPQSVLLRADEVIQ